MATTRRSEPRTDCAHCKGSGIVRVSKDPDEVADCPCTDSPLSAAERLDIVERRLGIVLMPWQRQWAMRALDGEHIVTTRARRAGWKTILRAVKEAGHV